ncbi:hypothetical protein ACFVJK_48935 [Streptomyces sp. NPDC127172]|uniref:hypothetical protein n=1 Tax=Streptomyces sp. NPDC127172 TaxID=3345382 RepID=UPI00362525EF
MSINFTQHALEEAVLTALDKTVGEALKGHRATMQETLEALDVDKLGVRLPDGTRVASIILTDPDSKPVISDEKKFLDWVAKHAPDEVVEETITVRKVRPAYLTALTTEMTKFQAAQAVLEGGVIVDVDGITMKEATRTHSVRWKDGDTSRDAVAAAWTSGQLAHFTGLRALIAGGEQ